MVIPLKRSRHPPAYVARSVAVGLFWAMTPTFGVQMAIVFVHWLVVRRLGRWDFNVVHAMAWTWVTNFVTLIPAYYTFYTTGQMLLGHWGDISGYQGFVELLNLNATFGVTESSWRSFGDVDVLLTYFDVIIKGWFVSMLVGCLPYAILGTWLGYKWSLRLAISHRSNVFKRRLQRARVRHLAEEARTG